MGPSPGHWFSTIPEEEEARLKDFIKSGLLANEHNMGGGASGSGGSPTLSIVEQTKVYTLVGDDANAKEKWHLWPRKQNKKRSN